jgi:hypothetical protein
MMMVQITFRYRVMEDVDIHITLFACSITEYYCSDNTSCISLFGSIFFGLEAF